MRRILCTILYKLGFRKQAYYVSPSIHNYLLGEDFAKNFVKGMQTAIECGKSLQKQIDDLQQELDKELKVCKD